MGKAKVRVYFRSGNSLILESDGFTTTRNAENDLTRLEYPGSDPHLMYIRLDAIEAITELKPSRLRKWLSVNVIFTVLIATAIALVVIWAILPKLT